jgi:hypothetical protein
MATRLAAVKDEVNPEKRARIKPVVSCIPPAAAHSSSDNDPTNRTPAPAAFMTALFRYY